MRPPAEAPDPGPDPPLVSILVPARNEASRQLRRCVESMLAQAWPRLEVVAVNDRSTDETLAILEELATRGSSPCGAGGGREGGRQEAGVAADRPPPQPSPAGAGEGVGRHPLVVIDGVEPPPSWLGKTHALHQALQAAGGEWVLAARSRRRHLHPRQRRRQPGRGPGHAGSGVDDLPGLSAARRQRSR
ncbi:MAG: glycosyltransferase [Armatimonadetes bacterium]|nr:glycosyltransferase [Armatimonadota bacterium]